MRHRFTILSLLLCFLPACPKGGDDAPPPAPSAEASISLGAGPPGGLGGLPGNGLSPGNGAPGAAAPGVAAPGTPPVPAAPGNAPGPGGPGAAQPASPGGGYGKAQ